MTAPAKAAPMREDVAAELELLRRREVQMIGAAISTRNWHDLETAYNAGRDRLDRVISEHIRFNRLAAAGNVRECTCHPDDRPLGACRRMFASAECQADAAGEDVERVARAIATKTYAFATVTDEGSDQYDCGEWEEFGCDAQATYRDAARAALAAMREGVHQTESDERVSDKKIHHMAQALVNAYPCLPHEERAADDPVIHEVCRDILAAMREGVDRGMVERAAHNIVLTSQLVSEADGFEIHGIFSSYSAAALHIAKDADLGNNATSALLHNWSDRGQHKLEYVGPGHDGQATHWCASIQPLRLSDGCTVRTNALLHAATALFPEGTMYRSGHDGTGPDPSRFFCEAISDAPECRRVRVVADTEAEARSQAAAALSPEQPR
jgi:hypothetical protein